MTTEASVPGLDALRAVVAAGTTPYRIAVTIGIRPDAVYRWLDGRTRPDTQFRMALERLFGVPASSWLTEKERVVAFGESGGRGAAGHASLTSAEEVNS